MSHPFGDLLRQYRARKSHLSQTRLAELAGYDQAVLTRMCQGKKDLTGPSGRERVIRIITVLREERALTTQAEANALLKTAGMPPLYEGQPAELALLKALKPDTPIQTHMSVNQTSPPPPKSNLPAQLTSFIGRETEIAEVQRLLVTTRLLTLTGSGGAGKTRLAIEVGMAERATARVAPTSTVGAGLAPAHLAPAPISPTPTAMDHVRYNAVWLVEYASITTSDLVAETVAASLGLQVMSRTALAVLADYLHDQRMLLILDNCEHLINACAQLAVALLRDCPYLTILATSREPLNVPGEVTWRVPPLQSDNATRLFAERARAAMPDFALTPAITPGVTQICIRLDGMPLALELAAARLRAFTVEQIAGRLDNAFLTLTGGSRVALPRQQTLRATIDWSYELLTDGERALLRELSVFAGGWTLEAAEVVHGAHAPELLEQLVNKSLVIVEERPTGMRYHLLETIRQYAAEQLSEKGNGISEAEKIHHRHMRYYTGFAATRRALNDGSKEAKVWEDILTTELGNLRAALDHAVKFMDWKDGERLLRVILLWHEPGALRQIAQWLDVLILSNPAANDEARLTGLLLMGNLLTASGDMVGCIKWYSDAVVLAKRIGNQDLWLEARVHLAYVTPDYAQAVAQFSEVIQYAHQAGRTFDEVLARFFLSMRVHIVGDYHQAATIQEKCLIEVEQMNELTGWRSQILGHLGQSYLGSRDYQHARDVLVQSIALGRATGGRIEIARVDCATAALYMGDSHSAREALRETFTYHLNIDNMERIAQGVVLAAGLAHVLGIPVQAARLLGAAAAIRRDYHTHGIYERELFLEYDRRLPLVQAALAPAEFEQAWGEGMNLSIREAINEALTI